MPTDIDKRKIGQDAKLLEAMTWVTLHKIPHMYRPLWSEVTKNAGEVCDGIYEAYGIPDSLLELKINALSFSVCALRKLERRLNIANMYKVDALPDVQKAKYDIEIHKIRVKLKPWLNSLKMKQARQNSAVMSAEELIEVDVDAIQATT